MVWHDILDQAALQHIFLRIGFVPDMLLLHADPGGMRPEFFRRTGQIQS